MITASSHDDISYHDFEINRWIGSVNSDLQTIDNKGPIMTAIETARSKGRVALLDAGCGIGIGLMGLKDQIAQRTDVDEADIEAVGVSLADYRDRADQHDIGWRGVKKLYSSYVNLEFGNLASVSLPQNHFDVAYAYQVLLHNDTVEPIIANILPTLNSNGAFYFDTLMEQKDEVELIAASLPDDQWQTQTKELTRTFMHGDESRLMHKISRVS